MELTGWKWEGMSMQKAIPGHLYSLGLLQAKSRKLL